MISVIQETSLEHVTVGGEHGKGLAGDNWTDEAAPFPTLISIKRRPSPPMHGWLAAMAGGGTELRDEGSPGGRCTGYTASCHGGRGRGAVGRAAQEAKILSLMAQNEAALKSIEFEKQAALEVIKKEKQDMLKFLQETSELVDKAKR